MVLVFVASSYFRSTRNAGFGRLMQLRASSYVGARTFITVLQPAYNSVRTTTALTLPSYAKSQKEGSPLD
jgi:hypothetical protein